MRRIEHVMFCAATVKISIVSRLALIESKRKWLLSGLIQ